MKSAGEIRASLVAPKMEGFDDLSASQKARLCISEILIDTAEKCGGFEGFTRAWLQMCEARGRHPLADPQTLMDYASIDRYCGYRLSEYEKGMEMQAFVRQAAE